MFENVCVLVFCVYPFLHMKTANFQRWKAYNELTHSLTRLRDRPILSAASQVIII